MTRAEPYSEEVRHAANAWCVRIADGELEAAEQAAFDAWIAADDHRTAFDDAVRIWRLMDEVSLTPDIIGLRRKALDNFRKVNRAQWVRSRPMAIAGMAAAVLVMIAAATVFAGRPTDYISGVGERRVVLLADGSKVSLDADTEVRVHYTAHRRELTLLHGRAKFSVAKDRTRPFTVAAEDKVVVATGTEFSVETVNHAVHVILYEGHVAVMGKTHSQPVDKPLVLIATREDADQILTPGHELVTAVASSTASVAPTDPARSLTWEAGQVAFLDTPLADAVEEINRYSDEKVVVGDDAVGRLKISGVFTEGDTSAFVEGAAGVLSLTYETVDGRVILKKKT